MTIDFLIGAIRASRDLHPLVKTVLEDISGSPDSFLSNSFCKREMHAIVVAFSLCFLHFSTST